MSSEHEQSFVPLGLNAHFHTPLTWPSSVQVKEVHVYGPTWNIAAEGYKTVMFSQAGGVLRFILKSCTWQTCSSSTSDDSRAAVRNEGIANTSGKEKPDQTGKEPEADFPYF